MNEQKSNPAAGLEGAGTAQDKEKAARPTDTQPEPTGNAATGANQGSPVAGVMKQFAKTDAESNGRR